MSGVRRLRVFDEPYWSGKPTLNKQIYSQPNTGYFVNSNELNRLTYYR